MAKIREIAARYWPPEKTLLLLAVPHRSSIERYSGLVSATSTPNPPSACPGKVTNTISLGSSWQATRLSARSEDALRASASIGRCHVT